MTRVCDIIDKGMTYVCDIIGKGMGLERLLCILFERGSNHSSIFAEN